MDDGNTNQSIEFVENDNEDFSRVLKEDTENDADIYANNDQY